MNAENFDLKALLGLRHSPVRNYVVPGLTSWLIGAPSPAGTIRMFMSEREHVEPICPHSHRFDFQAWVLRGSVRNRIWRESYLNDPDADMFRIRAITYGGDMGRYESAPGEANKWRYSDTVYQTGQCYGMKADQVHSIYFSRGAVVLFFEGPTVANESIALEPVANGETVPTFKVEPWMFQKPQDHADAARATSDSGLAPTGNQGGPHG